MRFKEGYQANLKQEHKEQSTTEPDSPEILQLNPRETD